MLATNEHEANDKETDRTPAACVTSQDGPSMPADALDAGDQPWVLRLGNWLTKSAEETKSDTPWAVALGSYLNEKKPGPWSLIANEKPQDPLALRLGTFLNETKPIGMLHRAPQDDSQPPSEPLGEAHAPTQCIAAAYACH